MDRSKFFIYLFVCLSSTSAKPSDWPKYCANLAMTGVAESGGAISPTTAPRLEPLWIAPLSGGIASSPTVVGDVVYIGDWNGNEWAINAADGTEIAHVQLGMTTAPQCEPAALGITSAAAVSDGVVYVAGGDDAFYALDADTLAIRWRHSLGDNSALGGYYGWCSPAVVGGTVLQGVSSNCDNPFVLGQLVAMDATSGEPIGSAIMGVPDSPIPNLSGAGIWTSPAIDLDRKAAFVTTGSGIDIGDGGHQFSIVRIDLQSFDIESTWKIDPITIDDADWGSSPTLFYDADGVAMVGAGQKDGNYYAFPRDDIQDGPVWQARLAVGGSCPQCGHGILSTAAFDGIRLYVGSGKPLVEGDWNGSVAALDPTTGEIIWRRNFANPVIAPVSYANGVVFTTTGNTAVALDAATGELLWSFTTNAQCFGGVAITDRGIFFGDLSGTLYAFGISIQRRMRAVRFPSP
jgi:polyvinyl alcohol dehydrogenase (cytochrome)